MNLGQAWNKTSRYQKNSETLKNLNEICENNRLKISISNTVIVDNGDTGIDKEHLFILLK